MKVGKIAILPSATFKYKKNVSNQAGVLSVAPPMNKYT